MAEVIVERLDGSLGITLRGGCIPDHPHLNRPLIITQVRQNGPAHRTGLIRVGDRLLKVDNHILTNKTLLEAQQLLKETSSCTSSLTIEYDVSIMESVKYANGPLLVEIDRQVEEEFGLLLTNCCELESEEILTAGFFVEHIVAASTADRCGALHIGDQILAIDDVVLDNWNGTPADAERMLKRATKLQILPYHTYRTLSRNYGLYPSSPSMAGFSTINSRRSRINRNRMNRQSSIQKSIDSDCGKMENLFGNVFC